MKIKQKSRSIYKFLIAIGLLFILCARDSSAKFLMGVTKIEKIYLLINTTEYVDGKQLGETVTAFIQRKIPDLKLESYDNYKESESKYENIVMYIRINSVDAAQNRGVRFGTNIDIQFIFQGHDDIGSYDKAYWSSGVMTMSTHRHLIQDNVEDALKDILTEFTDEWNETKDLLVPDASEQ
ncbi:hypothetical protein ACFLTD_02105 [Elusimicrobiota bacterium]